MNEIRHQQNEFKEISSLNDDIELSPYVPLIKIEMEDAEEEFDEYPEQIDYQESDESAKKRKYKKWKQKPDLEIPAKPKRPYIRRKPRSEKKSKKPPKSEVDDEFEEEFGHLPVTTNGKIVCPDCNRPIFKIGFRDHIERMHTDNSIRYYCDLCPKIFNRKESLLCHMYAHLKIKPFVCPENCGKSFKSKHGMLFHFKMHHQPLQEFICEICAKSFKQSHLLQEHIDAKHQGVRYKCTYEGCSNQYHTSNALKKHINSIHEWRLEPCEYCGETYRTGFSMYQHIRTNHKERKYVCEHEGCGKKFAIKTHYTDHMKLHAGKRDFICTICDARYHVRRNLTRHIQVVHQKSRFFCQISGCNAALCNKDNYRAHLRKVHANFPGVEKLLEGIAKLKPVFLDNIDGEDDGNEMTGDVEHE